MGDEEKDKSKKTNANKGVTENQLPLLDSFKGKPQTNSKGNNARKVIHGATVPAKGSLKEVKGQSKKFVNKKIAEEEKENASLEAFHKGLKNTEKAISYSAQSRKKKKNLEKLQFQNSKLKKDKLEEATRFEKEKKEEKFSKKVGDTSDKEEKFLTKKSTDLDENVGTAVVTKKAVDPRAFKRNNNQDKPSKTFQSYNTENQNFLEVKNKVQEQDTPFRFSNNRNTQKKREKSTNRNRNSGSFNNSKQVSGGIDNAFKQEVQQKVEEKFHEGAQDNVALETGLKTKELTDRPRKFVTKQVDKDTRTFGNFVVRKGKETGKSIQAQRQHRKMQKKAVQQGQKRTKEAVEATKKSVKAIIEIIKKTKTIATIAFVIIFLFSLLSACATLATGFFQGGADYMSVTTYYTKDKEIEASTLQWTDLEFNLKEKIDHIESEYPNFDEYQYNVGEMVHQPLELIAYLSAMHYDFTNPQVQSEIIEIFEQVNKLTLTPTTEIRYDENGQPYEWKILKIEMQPTSFEEVVRPRLEAEGKGEQYDLYNETTGNKQSLTSPVDFDWRNNISCYYGYRQDPTGAMGGGKEFHTGLDIRCPTGTNVYSTQYGVVAVAKYHNLYGNYIVINGANNVTTLYAHNSQLLVSVGDQVTPDTIIAKSGATGNVTGPHVHVEVKIGDQRVDPIFYLGTLPAGSQKE